MDQPSPADSEPVAMAAQWCTVHMDQATQRGDKEIAIPLDRGGYRETHLLLQLARDTARGEEEGGSFNGVGRDRIRENQPSALPEGERDNGGEMVCSGSL